MNPVPPNQLVPGRRYYIQLTNPDPGESGKKVGAFIKHIPRYDGNYGRVYFRELTDIPGAVLPSGFGTEENIFSDSPRMMYFEVKADDIQKRFEQRAFEEILGQDTQYDDDMKEATLGLTMPGSVRSEKIRTFKKPTITKSKPRTVGLDDLAVRVLSKKQYPDQRPPPGGGKRSRRKRSRSKRSRSKRSRSKRSRRARKSRKYKNN
jgi:hypothetical protein